MPMVGTLRPAVTEAATASGIGSRTNAKKPALSGDRGGDSIGDCLENNCENARLFECQDIENQLMRRLVGTGLLPHSAEAMHVLRGEAHMPHHRHARGSHACNSLGNRPAAFDLDR